MSITTHLQAYTLHQKSLVQAQLLLICLCSIAVHQHGADEGIDFTCVISQALYKKFTKVNLIGAGPGTVPIEFIRYQVTGRNQKNMPKGKNISIGTDVEIRKIKSKSKRSGEAIRNGVFACTTLHNGKQVVIPVFSHLETNSKY